jgi:hypothetical protein
MHKLSQDVQNIHLVYRGKSLTGWIGKQVALIRTHPEFHLLARAADKLYGLSPREIAIHFVIGVMSTRYIRTKYQLLCRPNIRQEIDVAMLWDRTPQGAYFWERLYDHCIST